MANDYWNRLKADVRSRRKLTFLYGRAAIPGTFTAEVYHEDCPMPLAVVWFGFVGMNAIQIFNSFVFEYARRAGLRSYIHEQMLNSYPGRYVISGAGTKSGTAWMEAIGYKRTAAGFEFHPKQKKKK